MPCSGGGDEAEDPTEARALPEDDEGDDFYDVETTAALAHDTRLFSGGAAPRRITERGAASAAGAAAGERENYDERYVLSTLLREEASEYADVGDSGNEDEENRFGFGNSVKFVCVITRACGDGPTLTI